MMKKTFLLIFLVSSVGCTELTYSGLAQECVLGEAPAASPGRVVARVTAALLITAVVTVGDESPQSVTVDESAGGTRLILSDYRIDLAGTVPTQLLDGEMIRIDNIERKSEPDAGPDDGKEPRLTCLLALARE